MLHISLHSYVCNMNSFIATSALLVIHLAIFAAGDERGICRITDENLEECLEEKAEEIGKFFGNTGADPLKLKLLNMNHLLFQGELHNVVITGIGESKMDRLSVNGSTMVLELLTSVTFKSDLLSQIGPLDISGTVFALLGNLRYTMTSQLREDASQTLMFDDAEANIIVGTMNIVIKLAEGTDQVIQDTVNKFVEAKGRELFKSVTEELEPVITELVTNAMLQLNKQ